MMIENLRRSTIVLLQRFSRLVVHCSCSIPALWLIGVFHQETHLGLYNGLIMIQISAVTIPRWHNNQNPHHPRFLLDDHHRNATI